MLLGGAALTRAYVENDLSEVYEGDVRYARDAFEGLRLMDALMAPGAGACRRPPPRTARPSQPGRRVGTAEEDRKRAERKARRERSLRIAAQRRAAEEAEEADRCPARSDVATDNPVPTPPFWGTRVVKGIALADYAVAARRAGDRSSASGGCAAPAAARARRTRSWWRPRAGRGCATGWTGSRPRASCEAAVVYGYFPAVSKGDDLVVLDDDGDASGSGSPSRGSAGTGGCAWPTSSAAQRLAARPTCVAVPPWSPWASGSASSPHELFAANAYRDYLEVHGLSVQLTEALAEYWHPRIREELFAAFGGEDPDDVEEFFKLGYRGARYSFGYPACPDLDDQQQVRRAAATRPDRRRAVRGVPAAPGAVHRRRSSSTTPRRSTSPT